MFGINHRISELMQREHLSKTEFAQRIGISLPLLTHICNDRNKPGLEVIQKILKVFGNINHIWLLFGEGNIYTELVKGIDKSRIANELEELFNKISEIENNVKTVSNYQKILSDELKHLHELNEFLMDSEAKIIEIKSKLNAITSEIKSD